MGMRRFEFGMGMRRFEFGMGMRMAERCIHDHNRCMYSVHPHMYDGCVLYNHIGTYMWWVCPAHTHTHGRI